MRRRDFIALFGGTLAASMNGHAMAAQQKAPARIGFISANSEPAAAPFLAAVRDGLAELGYVEPGTLTLDTLYASDARERIPALLEDLQRRGVAVIVTHAAATPIVVKAKRTVPAVYEFSADPVASGIALDLARPLYNATGVTLMRAELNSKRLEIMHEVDPTLRRIAVITNPLHAGEERERADLQAKAQQLEIELTFFPTPNREALEDGLAAISRYRPQAIVAFSEAFVVGNRERIIGFAASHRIPVVSGWAVMAKSGALFTYGPRLGASYRRVGYFVDRILKGANPADLPIEQPTVLELVINLKSSKALGLVVPPAVLARADTIIE